MKEKAGDIVSALMLLGLVAVVFVSSAGFPTATQENDLGPATFPRIIAVVIGICALFVLLRPQKVEPLPTGSKALRVVGIVLLLAVYAMILEPLGFVTSTFAFLVGALLLGKVRRPLQLILVPAGVSVGLFYLFYVLLEVSLPGGAVEGLLS